MNEAMCGRGTDQRKRFVLAIGDYVLRRNAQLPSLSPPERRAEGARLDDLVRLHRRLAARLEADAELRCTQPTASTLPMVSTRSVVGEKIIGYASVFYDGTPETEFRPWYDSEVAERIGCHAFDGIGGDDVRGLFNHDPSLVLGRTASGTLSLTVDDRGLGYSITADHTPIAAAVVPALMRGDISGSSFAFKILADDVREEGEGYIREIQRVELFDVGPVTYPAYEAASAGLSERSTRRFPVDTDVESLAMKRQIRALLK